MPSSPRTPTHSRRPSNISITSPLNEASSRQYSRTSIHTPTTPKRQSFHRADSIGIDVFNSGGATPANNGLGNLADELADAWEEDEDEEDDPQLNFASSEERENVGNERTRDSGVDVAETPPSGLKKLETRPQNEATLTPPNLKKHSRKGSEYDGSDYGEDSDLDSPGMPKALVAKMDAVDSLARRGTEDTGLEKDGVVKRVVGQLKDLGSQSGVESAASRLITAHTALSTHLIHQTRQLHSLTYPLLSPLTLPPSEETLDDILPLFLHLSEHMPRPTTAAFSSLTQLHVTTVDVLVTLSTLSDTLHMSRQTTTLASRRLKSARELVAEMRKEEEARDEGERWLRKGNWGERLEARECAKECAGVVGGFEEVCEGWRARLVKLGEVEALGA